VSATPAPAGDADVQQLCRAWDRIDELTLALRAFAEAGRRFWVTGDGTFADAYATITGEDLRRAWQALEGKR